MKICPNCKKQYADSVAVCPEDGTFLDLETPEPEIQTGDSPADAIPHVADTVDRIGTSAAETFDRNTGLSGTNVETVGDRISATAFSHTDAVEENPMIGWLVPLIILVLLVIIGYWFCGNSEAPKASLNDFQTNNSRQIVL